MTLEILPAPLKFKSVPASVEISKGGSAEVPVELERLFGFAEAVELSLVPPQGVPGFEAKPVSVAKGQGAGKLALNAKPEAPDGDHAFVLLAKMNFNGVACELRQPVQVKVAAAPNP